MKLSTVEIALIAIFAALQAILTTLPYSIPIGVAGFITLGLIGGAMIGILLGPVIGGFAVLLGSFIGILLNPGGAILGFLTVIPPASGAFSAGCIKIRRGYLPGLLILGSIAVFYSHPFGRAVIIFPWMHIIAMFLAFSPLAYLAGIYFSSSNKTRLILGIMAAAFVGVLTDHIVGSALAIWYFSPGLTPAIWYSILPIYPIERVVALILATIITAPLYTSMRRMNMF
jgi:hypothetical protein